MKYVHILLLSLLMVQFRISFAQYDPTKVNKKAVESYNKAMQLAQDLKYDAAIDALKQSIQQDPNYIEAYLSLGGVYGQLKNYKESIHYYEQAFSLDSN